MGVAGERQADETFYALVMRQLAQLVLGLWPVIAQNIGANRSSSKSLIGQAAGPEGHVLHEVLRQALRHPFLEASYPLVVKSDAGGPGTGEMDAAAHDLVQDVLETRR